MNRQPTLPGLERQNIFFNPLSGEVTMFGGDPDCEHVEDQRNYDGIRCIHCHGWYIA